jgi:hypothetical protein
LATDPSVPSSILFSFMPFFLTAFTLFHIFFPIIFPCLLHHHLFICTSPVPFSHFSIVVFPFFLIQFFFWSSPKFLSVSYLQPFSLPFTLTCNSFVFIPNLISNNSEFQRWVFMSNISYCKVLKNIFLSKYSCRWPMYTCLKWHKCAKFVNSCVIVPWLFLF